MSYTDQEKYSALPAHLSSDIIETMPVCFSYWDEEFKPLYCNKANLDFFGVQSFDEFKRYFNEFNPEFQLNGQPSNELGYKYMQTAIKDGSCKFIWTSKKKNGQLAQSDVTLVRVIDAGKVFLSCYLYDLQEQQKTVEKLQTVGEYTKILLDSSPLGTLIWDKDFNLLGANDAIAKIFGMTYAREFIGNFISLIPDVQPDGVNSFERMHKVLQDGLTHGNAQTYWLGQDLQKNPIPTEVIVVRVEHNDEFMMAGYIKDLRELEDSKKKVRAAEEFTSAMLNSVPIAISILDANFKRIDCNETMLTLFGFSSKEDALANTHETIPIHQPDGSNSMQLSRKKLLEAWKKGELNIEVMAQHVSGEQIPVEVKLVRSLANGKDIIICYMRDLRETKAHIKKIQEAETRVRTVIDSSPITINTFDHNGRLIDCNDASWQVFGFNNKSEFIENFHKVFPEYQPDGRPSAVMVQDALGKAMETGQYRIKAMARTIQGEDVPCDVVIKGTVINGEKAIISYVQDLREVNIALDKAHAATKAAEKSAKAKSEFLANMSHEIRTPMNGILGLLHLLSQTELSETQKSYLDNASLSANNLLRIINDILDFSKIEAGKLEIENTEFTLNEICDEIYSLFIPKVNEKGIGCNINKDSFCETKIIGDSLRLKQVLLNLISNAIKFTHHGEVKLGIKAVQQDDELLCTFTVSDTGIGLTEEQTKNLFTAFSQADSSVTRKYGGTGLGLIISKRIVEMMNGKIWVESSYGQGSTFTFTAGFKIASEMVLDKPSAPSNEVLQKEHIPSETQLLLVEDNQINQIIARELLAKVGYKIDIANNGQEALDMLDQKPYHLVLMDIQMPIMDGLTASKKIREQEKYKNLPIIAMSAHAMKGDKEISLQHGMNDHITKPIAPEILYKCLDTWLSGAS